MERKQAMVTHGVCTHTADSYAVALSQALACVRKSASVTDRTSMVQSFLKKEPVWHDGVLFTGSWG